MTDRDKIIEVMARAMCFGKTCRRNCPDVDHAPCPDALSSWQGDAEIMLAALHAKGLAVVPVEPTPEMMIAGLQSMTQRTIHSGSPEIIYRAMLAATNSPREESDE